MTIAPHLPAPWFVEVRFGYSKRIVDILHTLPGCRWDKDLHCWLVPVEFLTLPETAGLFKED